MRLEDCLRSLREASGLTRSEWAARSGVSRMTLWRWETGEALPRATELRMALRSLGATDAAIRRAQSLIQPSAAVAHRGDLLRALRRRNRWTQDEAARAAGVPRSTLAKWERLHAWPSGERLDALCHAYGASEEERLALMLEREIAATVLPSSFVWAKGG